MNAPTDNSYASTKPAKLLVTYIDEIVFAVLYNKGIIEDTSDNQTLIKRLSAANLGFYVKEYQGLLLHTTVLRFVRFHENRGRAKTSGRQLGISIEDIQKSAETYRMAYQERLHEDDKNLVKQELFEAMNYFAGILIELAQKFSTQVYDELGSYTDLKMRLYKGKQAQEELRKINTLLAELNTNTLNEISQQDTQIESYLSLLFMPAKTHCQTVLLDAVLKLESTLIKINHDIRNQAAHALIHQFVRLYKQKPNYQPSFDILAQNSKFWIVQHPLNGYANLYDINSRVIWQPLIAKLAPPTELPKVAPQSPLIDSDEHTIAETTSLLYEAVEALFVMVNQSPSQLIASQIYAKLAQDLMAEQVDLPTWLLTVAKFYDDYGDDYPAVHLHFEEQVHHRYGGNRLVSDIIISSLG